MITSTKADETPRRATPDDVRACYRRFLGRDPETAASVSGHLRGQPTLWALIQAFYNSPEAARRRLEQACAYISATQDGRDIEVVADPDEAARLTDHIAAVWSRYGREEAYFSVLTNPKYLTERLQVQDVAEFYDTGAQEVLGLEETLRRNGVAPDPAWTVLELGCGVGRMAEHFAARYGAYVGVDISAEHLNLARARLDAQVIANAQLLLLADFLGGNVAYDLFFSIIVLQHNPPPIIHDLLDRALEKLNPGGYASFQVPCFLYDYEFKVSDYLAGVGRLDHMEMHALPQRYVFALLAKHGLTPIEVTPNARIGPLGFSYGFLARKTL